MMGTAVRGGGVAVTTEVDLPVLQFAEGIPGFPAARRFVLVRLDEAGLVLDLQSLDDDAARFVVVPSVAFFPDYAPEIDDVTARRLGLDGGADTRTEPLVLLVVTVGATLTESTANLMAPIVVNTAAQVAAQVVLDDPDLPLRAPLTVA
jgi:flagellar assembly factor FliW